MVYVDELTVYPNAKRGGIFAGGSCHLTADTDEELHAFAARIGLRRSWFQSNSICNHYDLTPGRRAAAVAAGAKEEGNREGALRRRIARLGPCEA